MYFRRWNKEKDKLTEYHHIAFILYTPCKVRIIKDENPTLLADNPTVFDEMTLKIRLEEQRRQ
jgi:hypothetical protein